MTTSKNSSAVKPGIDREFANKFLRAVDSPMDYGVYFLFHDWFAEASQSAIDAYEADVLARPEAAEYFRDRYIAEPLELAQLERCAAGTLGQAYYQFVVDNNLEANLGRNYRTFNETLAKDGKLDRLPDSLSYMMVRGFQIHDFHHVLTGYDSSPLGELALAAFYLAQMRFPYHAMRMAVTTAHMAFVNPGIIDQAMDAIVDGWAYGKSAQDINFVRWEAQLDRPLAVIQQELNLRTVSLAA